MLVTLEDMSLRIIIDTLAVVVLKNTVLDVNPFLSLLLVLIMSACGECKTIQYTDVFSKQLHPLCIKKS